MRRVRRSQREDRMSALSLSLMETQHGNRCVTAHLRAFPLWVALWILAAGCGSDSDTPGSSSPVAGGPSKATRACLDSGGWCSYADGLCGEGAECECHQTQPKGCEETYALVCGCDGKHYTNTCKGQRAGVDVRRDRTGCPDAEGLHGCGWVGCEYTAACVELWTDEPAPSGYTCLELDGCEDCDCVELLPGCTCSAADWGRPHITCHLPL